MNEQRSLQRERQRLRYRTRMDNMNEEERSLYRERNRRYYRQRQERLSDDQRSIQRETRARYAATRRNAANATSTSPAGTPTTIHIDMPHELGPTALQNQQSQLSIRTSTVTEEQLSVQRERRRIRYAQDRQRFTDDQRSVQREHARLQTQQRRNSRISNRQQGTTSVRRTFRRRSTVHNSAREFVNSQSLALLQLTNTIICPHCQAKLFPHETNQICCLNGALDLPLLPSPSALIVQLLTMQSEEAIHFRQHIRSYNHVFAFTSMGVHIDQNLASGRRGVYTYRAQGAIYHQIGSLLPEPGARPRYLQMFIYDTDNEVEYRLLENNSLNRNLLCLLSRMLDECNPFVRMFRQISQRNDLATIRLQIKGRSNRPRYNLPTSSQVAAILVGGEDPSQPNERDIIVHTRSGRLLNVPDTAGYYDPLQYPLLLPYGTPGWDLSIFNESQERTSCRAFYSYHLQIRANHFSLVLHGGRLFQQYAVDNYVKISTQRLRYIRDHQPIIRAELYQRLLDSLNAGETRTADLGRRTILPATYSGSPRDMHQRYHNAMALVQTFGKPDLFITMTCNPNWEEIKNELLPFETPVDRPELTTRIFHSKFEELKNDIFKRGVLGKMVANVYVIEFQKRGLPHAHILVIFDEHDRLLSPDDYDKVVRAEIPDPHFEPELYNIVTKHMIHGPCGIFNPACVCMRNGQCKKGYPRTFASQTRQGTDSYPIYRRRNEGRSVTLNSGATVDNCWVVPYNPWLSKRYDCHINVEVCSTIKSVKYLYKYVYKGSDRVSMQISSASDNEQDEIRQFVDARWVCPQQATWNIFKFRMNKMYPSVRPLQLHLPNRHQVTFYEWQALTQIVDEEINSRTMLTEFFATNNVDQHARTLLYREFPGHYKWDKSEKRWQRRGNRSTTIGRIYAAGPSDGDKYFLRILLNHIRGPASLGDLLTVNSVRYTTFKQAAEQHGLLETDQTLRETLYEASGTHMPSSLRNLFATMLVFCEPVRVRELWDEFYEYMIEDYPSSSTMTHATNALLNDLNSSLRQHQKSTEDFDLPPIITDDDHLQNLINLIIEELSVPIPQEDLTSFCNLNDGQRHAFNRIMYCVDNNESAVFFIDGPGGTGKTYLYRAILAYVRSSNRIAIATATSGIAALMMPGGRTAHSRFKLPLNPTTTSTCQISKQSHLAQLLRQTSIIIWDEATMTKRLTFEALDRTMKDIMNNNAPFGGKLFVLGGDFRQVLPVVPRGSRAETIDACITNSPLWSFIERIHLTENMRARTDPSFSEFLLHVGNGTEPYVLDDMIKLPNDITIPWEGEQSLDALLNNVFPEIQLNAHDKKYMTERALLTPTNNGVDGLNEKVLEAFPGTQMTYYSFDSVEGDRRNLYQQDFLNSISPGGMPPHKLSLKIGAPIILLRNLDPKNGLCNGTRLLCTAFHRNVIQAEIVTGNLAGKPAFIPRIPLQPSENLQLPFTMTRKQFPVRLSFALTINKSQGQTIPHVGIFLPDHVFSHGQLYVALSRGVSRSTTKILVKDNVLSGPQGSYTRNVVYQEVLNSSR